ncbi:hypothetical protein GHV40_00990 [Devosia sp. D6-9]|nr:hypothetical protein GHV40_00990 [Devosia sp. D6-9]
MKRNQLIQKLNKEARDMGVPFSVNMGRGKGGHCIVFFGDKQTTVKSGEITPMYEKLIRKQLGLK